MPYLKSQQRRKELNTLTKPRDSAEVCYVAFHAGLQYLFSTPMKWSDRAAVIQALECAKLEFYRRYMAKYEDQKCDENGDVEP